ncbi:sensor domain-containing diguanylate cyclase [Scleromatobacter humisilvae]|uniref:PAS domain-containing protein n=1 Tax=Scleromatobacter humisilvae TaxID=2897159 RepID=A0A9X2C1R8_9BURK|nr:sensor domain-containing diguanylate cyclase [Scleromatobacter humisilvae]MCK9687871.1 PAS domain-containing protein [Scleromatobacter humisilvae]
MDSSDSSAARMTPARADAAARAQPTVLGLGVRFVMVAAGYYLTARLGLLIPYVGTHISLVWLPTGIAVAAFRRWGAGMTLAVYVGAVAANASVGGPLWVSLLVGVGNTAGTALAAWLLRRGGFDDRLLRRRDVTVLLGAVALGMCVTSLNGVAWLRVAGAPESAHFGQAWLAWFVGDSVGALLAGVPLIAWSRDDAAKAFLGRAGVGNMALQAIVLACGLAIFAGALDKDSALVFPLLALPTLVLALLAMRGGVVASSTGVLVLAMAAAWGTARGLGPFALRDASSGSLALWSYVTAQACTSLLISGIGMALQSSRRQFAAFLQNTPDGILVIDEQGTLLHANAAFAAMTGLDADALPGHRASEVLLGDARAVEALIADGAAPAVTELTLPRAGREPLHIECAVARYQKASGHWQTHVILRDVTQARRAQARLETSEARLKAVSDHVPALFAYVDRSQTYRFANAHFVQVMGVAPDQVIGRTMRDFLGESAHDELRPHIEGALRGERQKFERTGWKQNAQTHFLAEYVPDRRADGSVDGFFLMVLDITDRHRAELALARSEALVRTIANQMPGLISRMDRDYRYTFANAYYERWFALGESPVGRTIAEVFGDAVFDRVRGRIDEALAGRDVRFDFSNTMNPPDAPAYMEVHYVPDRDEQGRVTGVFSLVTDRSESQRARERIEASERQLRAVTDNLPMLVTYVDAEERLRFMNGTFHEWLGVDLAKSVGRPLVDVVGAEHYESRREHLRAALAGKRVEFEVVSQTLSGPRNLQTVYIPDARPDGKVHGIFTLSTDVTALKNVQQELQRLARIDTLTGLANRRQFDELLEQALARYRRTQRPLALIFLDIDHFKAINDGHGHGVGDTVLKEFAARLLQSLRETDVAARLSGDEFVVILDGLAARDEAVAVANKLLLAIRVPMTVGDRTLDVTVSMGLAYLDGSVEVDAKALMVRADRALYRAKDGGRDALGLAED